MFLVMGLVHSSTDIFIIESLSYEVVLSPTFINLLYSIPQFFRCRDFIHQNLRDLSASIQIRRSL
jgi:hypothetical protein